MIFVCRWYINIFCRSIWWWITWRSWTISWFSISYFLRRTFRCFKPPFTSICINSYITISISSININIFMIIFLSIYCSSWRMTVFFTISTYNNFFRIKSFYKLWRWWTSWTMMWHLKYINIVFFSCCFSTIFSITSK